MNEKDRLSAAYPHLDNAEGFLFSGRGLRCMSRTGEIAPRAVNKKSFVLNRSTGVRFYGH
ncbi:hypothetical protein Cmtc_62620 [Cupriavidus sp. TKC]|nr:hypothetical protein Cmtc_62620 [Cupriavidus sp. TKC]